MSGVAQRSSWAVCCGGSCPGTATVAAILKCVVGHELEVPPECRTDLCIVFQPQVESNQPAPRRRAHFYSRSAQLASPSDSRSGGGGTPTAGARRTSDTGRMRREWSSEATAPGQGGIANREPTGAGNGSSTLKEPRAGGSPTVITDLPGSGGGRQDGVTASNGGTDDGHDAASAGAVTPFPDAAGGGDRRERPSLPALFGGEKKMFPSSAPVGDGGATPSSGGGSRASGGGGKTPPGVRRRSAATDTPSSNASGVQLSAATEFLTAALTKREAQIEEMQAEMVKLQEAVASREASAESLVRVLWLCAPHHKIQDGHGWDLPHPLFADFDSGSALAVD